MPTWVALGVMAASRRTASIKRAHTMFCWRRSLDTATAVPQPAAACSEQATQRDFNNVAVLVVNERVQGPARRAAICVGRKETHRR